MNIETKKLSLIERLMKVKRAVVLNELDEILQKAEMEARARESLKDIEEGNVISLEQFAKNNRAWFQEQRTK